VTPVTFELVFDASEAGYRQWWFPACGLTLVAVFMAAVIYYRNQPAHVIGRWQLAGLYFGAVFSILWVLMTFFGTFFDYWTLRQALRSGDFETVEGKVANFVPMPREGHAMDRFTVNGHHYEYSDFVVTAGFNNTQFHGGPIREGSIVRIADVGGRIARLEIAR
jgi:hypothetical protein